MEVASVIEVDVNGQGTFLVSKEVLASFSARINNLFGTPTGRSSSGRLKVIFHDFPGGSQGFELLARFCYTNGGIEIAPFNLVLLKVAAHFMEIRSNKPSGFDLVDQLDKSIEVISLWTWSELLVALRQCQDLLPATTPPVLLDKILDCLVTRINLHFPSISSPSPFRFSSDNASYPSSSDASTASSSARIHCCATTWWFEDLLFLDADLFGKLVRIMVIQKLDHSTIFKFLVFYSRLKCLGVSQSLKCKIIDSAMMLLPLLDGNSLSCKGLFEVHRIMSSLKRVKKHQRISLERLIGRRLDQATLDHLLVRPRRRKLYKFDACLVLRMVNEFLLGASQMESSRAERVASLIDSYSMEVAPDAFLRPSKFAALVSAMPDSARISFDKLYQAIDMYFKVHLTLSEEQKMRICCSLNYEKLSTEALGHLSKNSKFPIGVATKVLLTQQLTPNRLLLLPDHLKHQTPSTEQMVVYLGKGQVLMEGEDVVDPKLKSNNRWRIHELDKGCSKMGQSHHVSYFTRSGLFSPGKTSYLPKLCS